MTEDLKNKLQNERDQTDWSMLASYHERGVLFLVAKELDLVEAGMGLALNDVEKVKSWQQKNLLYRPMPNEVEKWKLNQKKIFAHFIIIQPFVLFQTLD